MALHAEPRGAYAQVDDCSERRRTASLQHCCAASRSRLRCVETRCVRGRCSYLGRSLGSRRCVTPSSSPPDLINSGPLRYNRPDTVFYSLEPPPRNTPRAATTATICRAPRATSPACCSRRRGRRSRRNRRRALVAFVDTIANVALDTIGTLRHRRSRRPFAETLVGGGSLRSPRRVPFPCSVSPMAGSLALFFQRPFSE